MRATHLISTLSGVDIVSFRDYVYFCLYTGFNKQNVINKEMNTIEQAERYANKY